MSKQFISHTNSVLSKHVTNNSKLYCNTYKICVNNNIKHLFTYSNQHIQYNSFNKEQQQQYQLSFQPLHQMLKYNHCRFQYTQSNTAINSTQPSNGIESSSITNNTNSTVSQNNNNTNTINNNTTTLTQQQQQQSTTTTVDTQYNWFDPPHPSQLPKNSSSYYIEYLTICIIFAICGSTAVYLIRPLIQSLFNIQGTLRDGPNTYRILYILLLSPSYYVVLYILSRLTNRRIYFEPMIKRMWGRLLPKSASQKLFKN